jgi:fructokinase
MKIVCLGEFILDMFPAETGVGFSSVSAFLPVPGGAPANVAVAAARAGEASAFIGKVGDDAFGRRLASVLRDCGVETRGMRFDPACRTTLNFITLPDRNSAEYLFYRNPGADMMLRPDELDRALLRQAVFFHFGSVSLTEEPCRSATLEAAREARAGGALVSFDVNYRPTLWRDEKTALAAVEEALPLTDIVKVNEREIALLSRRAPAEEACREVLDLGPALCAATLGPQGCAFAARAGGGSVPGFTVDAVDATGCGDAFMGTLLAALAGAVAGAGGGERRARLEAVTAGELRSALRRANAAGALTATRKGVIPALPTAAEVREFLAGR